MVFRVFVHLFASFCFCYFLSLFRSFFLIDFFPHNALDIKITLQILCLNIMVFNFVFMDFLFVEMCAVSCAFWLFFFSVCFSLVLSVSILSYFYFLCVFVFSWERERKGLDLDWWWSGKNLEAVRRGMWTVWKKIYFQQKQDKIKIEHYISIFENQIFFSVSWKQGRSGNINPAFIMAAMPGATEMVTLSLE